MPDGMNGGGNLLTNIDAEKVVLGALLDSAEMPEKLRPEHFAEPVHGSLFSELQRRAEADVPRHAMQVQSWWSQQPFGAELDADGPYLSELLYVAASDESLAPYVAQVIEYAERRALDGVGERLRLAATDTACAPKDALEDAERDLAGLAETGSTGRRIVTARMALEGALSDTGKGEPSGWSQMDRKFTGWRGGRLYIAAGRPGMGKSLFGAACALNVARRGKPVAFVSLEMGAEEVALRIAASISGLSYSQIEREGVWPEDRAKLETARELMDRMSFTILDMPGASVASARSALRRLDRDMRRRNGQGLSLAVVDYLGLVTAPERGMGLYEATTKNSQALKGMARELNLPVLVLAQLSRAVEGRNDKHPMLSDLRDSGAIEQDADAVFGLYREAYYAQQTDVDELDQGELAEHMRKLESKALDVDILKQRGGETGRVKLYCNPATGEIMDMGRDAA